MKKVIILAICAVLVIVFIASATIVANEYFDKKVDDFLNATSSFENTDEMTVVVTVDGIAIYKETIDFLIAGYEFSQENLTQQTGNEMYNITVPTREEIIAEQIKQTVVLQEAKRLGLEYDYDKAYKSAKESYDMAKEINDENYKLMLAYMDKRNLSEEEYLKLIAQSYQNSFTRNNLYNDFIKDKQGTEEELKNQFDAYVEQLLEKAEIVYK